MADGSVRIYLDADWQETLFAVAEDKLDEAARVVERGARARAPIAPYDTPGQPHMRSLIHTVAGEDADGPYRDVVSPADYTAFVEFGTKPHVIESRGPWPLRDARTGRVFGRRVNHPGTRAQPFLRPALYDIVGRKF